MSIADWEPGTELQGWLASVGITQEFYNSLKASIGLPPDCSCAARAAWMNRAWRWAWSRGIRNAVIERLWLKEQNPQTPPDKRRGVTPGPPRRHRKFLSPMRK